MVDHLFALPAAAPAQRHRSSWIFFLSAKLESVSKVWKTLSRPVEVVQETADDCTVEGARNVEFSSAIFELVRHRHRAKHFQCAVDSTNGESYFRFS